VAKIIKEELRCIRNNNWTTFAQNFEKYPISSKAFWKRIKNTNCKTSSSIDNYPKLVLNDIEYSSDTEKANIFGDLLKENFSNDKINNFDNDFKDNIDVKVKNFIKNKIDSVSFDGEFISRKNLDLFLKNLRPTVSSGEDKITNIMLIK
jgi:hypothetical protein